MNFAQRQGISISKLISCVTLWCLCCVLRFASIHQMQASHCLSSVRWQRLPREWWSELGKDSAVSGGKNQLQSIIMKCWTASNFEAQKTCLDTKQTIMFSLKDIEFCPVKTFHCFKIYIYYTVVHPVLFANWEQSAYRKMGMLIHLRKPAQYSLTAWSAITLVLDVFLFQW